MTYSGSEDWIRNNVHKYILNLMSEVSYLYTNI